MTTPMFAVAVCIAASILYGIRAGVRIRNRDKEEREGAGLFAVVILFIAVTGAFIHVANTQDYLLWRQWLVVAAMGGVIATQLRIHPPRHYRKKRN